MRVFILFLHCFLCGDTIIELTQKMKPPVITIFHTPPEQQTRKRKHDDTLDCGATTDVIFRGDNIKFPRKSYQQLKVYSAISQTQQLQAFLH